MAGRVWTYRKPALVQIAREPGFHTVLPTPQVLRDFPGDRWKVVQGIAPARLGLGQ